MLIFADEPSKPRKTRGIHRDYRKLHNPYESEEHQQKSTFLIPSYSILLHLIPLILGVRRE